MQEPIEKDLALLDANVLYGNMVRHVLLSLAEHDVYIPLWTDRIQDEWSRNLAWKRPEITEKIVVVKKQMAHHFPGAFVDDYEDLENVMKAALPDPDDAHVLAAAVTGQASIIVTENTRDFPAKIAAGYEITIMTADQFVTKMIRNNIIGVTNAFTRMVIDFKNPPVSTKQMLDRWEEVGLKESVRILRELYINE